MENDCNVDTKKVYSKVEDFLKDDDFIKYVLDDAPESAFHWDKLLKEHAELLKVFEEAKNVLLVSDEAMEVMTLSEERKLKIDKRIGRTYRAGLNRTLLIRSKEVIVG